MDLESFLGYQSQRAMFVARHMSVATFSSVTFGLLGGTVGAFLFPLSMGPVTWPVQVPGFV